MVHVDLAAAGTALGRGAGAVGDLVSTRDVSPSALIEQRLGAESRSVRAWLDAPVGHGRWRRCRPAPRARGRRRSWTGCSRSQRRRAGAQLAAGPVFDLGAGFRRATRSAAGTSAASTLREHAARGPRHRRAAAPVPRAERPVLPGGRRGPGGAQRLDGGLRLRRRPRRALRVDLRQPRRQPDPESLGRRPAGGALAQLHHGGQQPPADRRGWLRDDRGRAGGLRQGRADPGPAGGGAPARAAGSSGRRAVASGGSCPRSPRWRCGRSTTSRRAPLPRSASDTVVLRVLGTAGLHGALGTAAGAIDRAMDSLRADVRLPHASARRGRRGARRAPRCRCSTDGLRGRARWPNATSTGRWIRSAAGWPSRPSPGWRPTSSTARAGARPSLGRPLPNDRHRRVSEWRCSAT